MDKQIKHKVVQYIPIAMIFVFVVIIWSQDNQGERISDGDVKSKNSTYVPTEYSDAEKAEYREIEKRIQHLNESKRVYELADLGDEILSRWKQKNLGFYPSFLDKICGSLSGRDFDNTDQYLLARKCTKKALEKRGEMLVEQEIDLVGNLSSTIEYSLKLMPEERWPNDRRERTEYWGHAWQRLANEIDENYDFDAKFPIWSSKMTSEEREEARKYTRQRILHKVKKSYSKQFKDFLVGAYVMPPSNNAELERLLRKYVSDLEFKDSILAEIERKIAKSLRQEPLAARNLNVSFSDSANNAAAKNER